MTLRGITGEREKTLLERMRSLGVRDEDIDEQFVRASGAGGQKINKTSSCVILHHRPTGIRVKCQKERSQSVNRSLARKILLDKIEAKLSESRVAQQQESARMRRQKRTRSRRAKLQMLADKRQQGQKKMLRARVRPEEHE